MTAKRIAGLVLIALSIACLVFVVLGIHNNIAHTGAAAGKITSYKPPFYGHGLLIIGIGVAGAVLFLTGIAMVGTSKKDKF